MKFTFIIIGLFFVLTPLLAQFDSLRIFNEYPHLTQKEKKNFIKIGHDSSGNVYYLYNRIAYQFLDYNQNKQYVIYVQIFSPVYRTTRKDFRFQNTKTICTWVVNFENKQYHFQKTATYDSAMNYITGDSFDVYLWKFPEKNSIQQKLIDKAFNFFYNK